MIKTGIFGGSFDPIHSGHITLARTLLASAGLDEVWLMVSPQNPLKVGRRLQADGLRLAIARIALHGVEGVRASGYELHLPRPSYTWHTLQCLRRDFPDREFTLLIGGDNWANFGQWRNAADIICEFPIVVYPREGASIDTESLPSTVRVVSTRLLPVSSTMVRTRVAEGLSVCELVPPEIEKIVRRCYS